MQLAAAGTCPESYAVTPMVWGQREVQKTGNRPDNGSGMGLLPSLMPSPSKQDRGRSETKWQCHVNLGVSLPTDFHEVPVNIYIYIFYYETNKI